jgi:hypothetical protein
MRSMKWIAGLSATSAALPYVGIPIEYKQVAIAGLGVTVMLMAVYNVLRYGPLVQGIERRAAMRAASKVHHAQRASVRVDEVPVVAPAVRDEVGEEEEVEQYHRIAISRSTAARPPRARRATGIRRPSEHAAPALVTMLPVEDHVTADDSSHA